MQRKLEDYRNIGGKKVAVENKGENTEVQGQKFEVRR
jgi:hypothetical protein